jgi:hypothetical protein
VFDQVSRLSSKLIVNSVKNYRNLPELLIDVSQRSSYFKNIDIFTYVKNQEYLYNVYNTIYGTYLGHRLTNTVVSPRGMNYFSYRSVSEDLVDHLRFRQEFVNCIVTLMKHIVLFMKAVPSLKERPLGISELVVKDFGSIFDKSSAS